MQHVIKKIVCLPYVRQVVPGCNVKIKYEVLSNEGGYLGPSMHAQSGRNEVAGTRGCGKDFESEW